LDPAQRQRHEARHLDAFDTWMFEADEPLASLAALRNTLAELPTEVIRAKGLVAVADSGRPVRFHLVGRMLANRFVDAWPEDWTPGTSRIAVLGAAGTLDPDALHAAFSALLHPAHV
ncbi:MAG: GTP-binding protein, partial [Bacteroidota bacterium]